MIDGLVESMKKLVPDKMVRNCPDATCPYIKTAIIDTMIPYIKPLAQVVEEKASAYVNNGNESTHLFVADVMYEVMATMGKFAGTSVRVTLDVCNACTQAASIQKEERH